MSKSLKHILLPAKEEGWELWQLSKDKLQHEKSIQDLNDSSVPKDTRIAFPASVVTTTPLTILDADRETQKSIAKLQLEQSGLLKSGSESWGIYTVDKEIPLVTGVSLVEELVVNSKFQLEQAFDLAARFYSVGDLDTILCKQEQGSWVTICYKQAKPFYVERTESLSSLSTQIKSLLIQFTVQDIPFFPIKITIELGSKGESIDEALVNQLEKKISAKVELTETVNPVFNSSDDLNLIPSYIASARKKKKRNEKLKLYLFIGACLYGVVCIILFKQYRQREDQIQESRNEVAALEPQWIEHQRDLTKLNELDEVLTNQWPLATFEKIVSHLPSHQELRFQVVDIQSGSILIKGVSPNINLINTLYPALKKDPYFKNYKWRMPAPVVDRKTKLWSFTIEALKKGYSK